MTDLWDDIIITSIVFIDPENIDLDTIIIFLGGLAAELWAIMEKRLPFLRYGNISNCQTDLAWYPVDPRHGGLRDIESIKKITPSEIPTSPSGYQFTGHVHTYLNEDECIFKKQLHMAFKTA